MRRVPRSTADAAGAELGTNRSDGFPIQKTCGLRKYIRLLHLNVLRVEAVQAPRFFEQRILSDRIESSVGREPVRIQALHIAVQSVGFAMIVFEPIQRIQCGSHAAHAREERFLLIRGVAAASFTKIAERGTNR